MDWKYILSLNTEDLEDEEKDELYHVVTWFDCDSSDLNFKKCVALLKVSQEILKYKGEQVETLLHELDELAIKQAEEETKKAESEADLRSSRSKRSGSIELENLEQKYLELKSKYKKIVKTNEVNTIELEKANNKLKKLEIENKHLHSEIRAKATEGSESDISETIKDQQKELVNTIHNKNQQISELLQDMEEIEKENFVLREKLSSIREELSATTKEMNSLTEKLNSNDVRLKENEEIVNSLSAQNDLLREEIDETKNQKLAIEKELEDFSYEVNTRIEEWKRILDQKNAEIEHLQALSQPQTFRTSPTEDSSISDENVERTHIIALNQVLAQRERELVEMQTQLQIATSEMEESTEIIQKLKEEREVNEKNTTELKELLKDVQKQLKSANERGQKLQEEVNFLRKLSDSKDADLVKIIKELKENGEIDMADCLKRSEILKSEKRLMENQIISLVKATNSLQENCDILNKENSLLREKLGIAEDEIILSEFDSIQKRQTKEVETLKKKLRHMEEQRVELKMEVQKLNRIVASLSDQIIESGKNPNLNSRDVQVESSVYNIESKIREEIKQLSEENEALRKGMHEILNSIKIKADSSTKEIQSNTLEKLLRALDVKHISGWYHPAMRLQAELHNAEGINKELRIQLRETKLELQQVRDTPRQDSQLDGSSGKEDKIVETVETIPICSLEGSFEIGEISVPREQFDYINKDLKTIENIYKILETLSANLPTSEKIGSYDTNYIRNGLIALQQLVGHLTNDFSTEKNNLSSKLNEYQINTSEIEEKLEISEKKLKIYEETESDESRTKAINKIVAQGVSTQRKLKFLQNEIENLKQCVEVLKKEKSENQTSSGKTIIELSNTIKILRDKLEIAQNDMRSSVNFHTYKNLQVEFDNTTIKYRKLIESVKRQTDDKTNEIRILMETQKGLEEERNSLKLKLTETLAKLHFQNVQTADENLAVLAQKLSESQVNEISEKQRANHTNNLYELVKEQLHKSEDKFKEFPKFNEDILHKNLTLQEQLKNIEDKHCYCVDRELFESEINVKNGLFTENSELKLEISKVREEFKAFKENFSEHQMWNNNKEQELLNLKHQIVDLIADSDEKMMISQLNSDLLKLRQKEAELNNIVEANGKTLKNLENERDIVQKKLDMKEKEYSLIESAMTKKISALQELISKLKYQYLGCVPLCSEESFLENLKLIHAEKHNTFMALLSTKNMENNSTIIKEQCEIELQTLQKRMAIYANGGKDEMGKLSNWLQEKKNLQISELRFRRQSDYKETQIQHLLNRIKSQDEQIAKLDEELLLWHKNFDFNEVNTTPIIQKQLVKQIVLRESVFPEPPSPSLVLMKNQDVQTEAIHLTQNVISESPDTSAIRSKHLMEILSKDQAINSLKKTITELEMNVSLFRKQLGDKQSQISFYEKHILELQNKRQDEQLPNMGDGDNVNVGGHSEIIVLKNNTIALQEQVMTKDQEIVRYQTLLKKDRDEHSLAAARLQEELQTCHKVLADEKQKCERLEQTLNQQNPKLSAIEQYINQVHALEKHTAELHTNITSLEAQLQSCREESVRWRSLANDRLEAMEQLRKSLDEQHKRELTLYKTDCEKIKELSKDEINTLQQLVTDNKSSTSGKIDSDNIRRVFKEKDDKIIELTSKLRHVKNELKRGLQEKEDGSSLKVSDLESYNSTLVKEHELLKKRHEQLMNKERTARDEIRELKTQLLKKSSVPVKADKSERTVKEQLQKKISSLENEKEELNRKLSEQMFLAESHRLKTAEDFDKWKKMKQFQQNSEKLKSKLKEREEQVDKLQQTCSGYRLLIEKLEREKHNLENRIKVFKNANSNIVNLKELELLKTENTKLYCEIEVLNSKLEMQQHHSGALGAAMLQEKLESQERKIAIFEVTAKGSAEARSEMERLHATVSSLQKINLRLEAENLELKMDLEKSNKEIPHFLEQIQHLENYVEALKKENSAQELKKSDDSEAAVATPESKKVSELERTVFILKRVVEKLQAENKRLLSGKRPLSERATSADKLQRDHHRLKEHYTESIQKVSKLEAELSAANSKIKAFTSQQGSDEIKTLVEELSSVKAQLGHKSNLLDKVKILLHKAAAKEKRLVQEITELRNRHEHQNVIHEESEEEVTNSDIAE